MIQNIWIIDKDSGRNMFHKVYGEQIVDKDLFSGFLTALYSFAESEVQSHGLGLESVNMGGLQWLYSQNKGLLFIIAADKTDQSDLLRSQLELVKDAFAQKFTIFLKGDRGVKFLRKWDGSPKAFKEFSETIDSYVESWAQATQTVGIADRVDTIEVFQHIFNTIREIDIPFYKNPGKVWSQIGEQFRDIVLKSDLKDSVNILEGSFIDLLPLVNPQSSHKLEDTIKALVSPLYKIIGDVIGQKKLEEQLILKIVPYLKRDWRRIKDLNLDGFIIENILL